MNRCHIRYTSTEIPSTLTNKEFPITQNTLIIGRGKKMHDKAKEYFVFKDYVNVGRFLAS